MALLVVVDVLKKIPAKNFIERATNTGLELRRYYDEAHFQAYLKKMKKDNEKVRVLYLYPQPIPIQNLDQWLG